MAGDASPWTDTTGQGSGMKDAELRARLRHVYWLGGGSGAGKSTVARRLAAQHGLRVYATDDAMADHARRSTPEDAPYLAEFQAMGMDERWVNRSPAAMLETFHWFRGEGFGRIVEDLLRLPAGPGVIAEGFRLLPRLVQPLLAAPGHAVWLLPTPAFRQAVFDRRRGTGGGYPGQDQRPEPRAAEPARTRPAVHRPPPRRGHAAEAAHHPGRHSPGRGRTRAASRASARTLDHLRQ